ncbi:predicted protein, partial [Nematostella vectensis]
MYKDPPPRPTQTQVQGERLVTVMPVFDESHDVRYTIDRFQSSCKYWDIKKEVWRTDGCKVGNLTTLNKIHCICNHLTAFGGGLLVAPNPIDFDKVWAGFKNISDNLAVVVTIATGFGLYIVLVLWARRKDKGDMEKVKLIVLGFSTVETDTPFGEHLYELSIHTGSWRGSSTTAKVLGPLLYIRIWHDMSGYDSSWYLNFVIAREIETNANWIFMCDRWLALEKDDGMVDRVLLVSTDKDLKTFKTLFNTKVSTDLFDGHLWMSVVKKPPKSSFTRVQRLTCCMSLLYTTMMTGAMFYNVGGVKDNSTISLGPLTFSVRQLMIGIQSSFIALPGNMIVIQIFRNLKPQEVQSEVNNSAISKEDNLKNASEKQSNSEEDKPNGKKVCLNELPHWLLYIAWTLCISMILVSATITLFYSMMWGKDISNQWLSSMLVSFFQDAFVTQPIKVCAIAVFVAAVLKTLPKDFSEFKQRDKKHKSPIGSCSSMKSQEQKDTIGKKSAMELPDPVTIEKARKFKLKETQMIGIMSSISLHIVFLTLLVVVGYNSRDPMSYNQMKVIEDGISKTVSLVVNIKGFWGYVGNIVLPFAFNERGYNGLPRHKEGVTADTNLFMIGMPRFRQLRVKREKCEREITALWCYDAYSAFNEDKSYFLPGWRTRANLSFTECPVPWRHKDFIELNTVPYWGNLGWYGGGGYTADLGYNIIQAQGIVKDLVRNNWLDQQTRATFIEFTVFNAQVNLFSVTTFLLESLGTGGGFSLLKIDTFRLHPHVGSGQTLVILLESVVLYGAFAIFAYVVFGPQLGGFGTFMQTCQALFAMMLGKGYYTELSRVDPILGPLFFSFFTVSMMFFMLNMFVAVLM